MDKNLICSLFDIYENRLESLFNEAHFESMIIEEHLHLAALTLSSIGGILQILHPKEIGSLTAIFSDDELPGYIKFLKHMEPFKRSLRIERGLTAKLAGHLHEKFRKEASISSETTKDEQRAAIALGAVSADSIQERVSIPKRISSCLMRRGYAWRAAQTEKRLRKQKQSEGSISSEDINERDNDGLNGDGRPARRPVDFRPLNKLVVLRRWSSHYPKVPRPYGQRVPGGGFYLRWEGKGIVIDPGHDFIQNFYDQAFSIEDIDAVFITHCHPDHSDELPTLLMLIHEWNEYWEKMPDDDDKPEFKQIDLFLNESAYRKFESWICSPMNVVSSVRMLPTSAYHDKIEWKDRGQRDKGDEKHEYETTIISLRKRYHMEVEIVPARHPDIIGKISAIGFKFRLFNEPGEKSRQKDNGLKSDGKIDDEKLRFIIGFTGDTGHFKGKEFGGKSLEDHYAGCDIVVSDLGDLGLKELLHMAGIRSGKKNIDEGKLYLDIFGDFPSYSQKYAYEFVVLLAVLRLAYIAEVKNERAPESRNGNEPETDYRRILKEIKHDENNEIGESAIYALKELIKRVNWGRPYPHRHLGFKGLLCLFEKMWNSELEGSNLRDPHKTTPAEPENPEKLLIIDEFPEDQGSYRNEIARILNLLKNDGEESPKRASVRCLTSDIGLHIGLGVEIYDPKTETHTETPLSIRCIRCLQNNDLSLLRGNYHPIGVKQVQETIVKRMGNAMVYLCAKHEHGMMEFDKPETFLNYHYASFPGGY